jgi:hypothetical protein
MTTEAVDVAAMMLPELEHQQMRDVLRVCGSHKIAHKTGLMNLKELTTLMMKLTQWLVKTVHVPL